MTDLAVVTVVVIIVVAVAVAIAVVMVVVAVAVVVVVAVAVAVSTAEMKDLLQQSLRAPLLPKEHAYTNQRFARQQLGSQLHASAVLLAARKSQARQKLQLSS